MLRRGTVFLSEAELSHIGMKFFDQRFWRVLAEVAQFRLTVSREVCGQRLQLFRRCERSESLQCFAKCYSRLCLCCRVQIRAAEPQFFGKFVQHEPAEFGDIFRETGGKFRRVLREELLALLPDGLVPIRKISPCCRNGR